MPAEDRFFCAEAARRRGDPMAGTAPHGLVWILVEYRGGWPVNGFDGLGLDPGTKALVYSSAQAARARVLLIRRHGRRRTEGVNRWAVLRYDSAGDYRQQWGTWRRDEDLAGIADALDAPGELGCPPVVLVCTHGRHDTCCAVRGRPVARALHERWPNLVWECSHVGGDRFAANLVVAPDGVYYGDLDADSCLRVVEEHLAGRIHAEHLRGYTDLLPPQQAAVAALLTRFGPAGRHDYAVTATFRDADRWRIRIVGRPPRPPVTDVGVHAYRTPPHRLTCRGAVRRAATVYEITSVGAAADGDDT
ncbi:sucrase ferredoxin [Streptomyces reniochalinae]|uniref:Sucrase ferredoxin n=1 Tax=Streptomyces reniochalinae TaxID=2250578 RepID=A0A367EVW7_9ACTN|nr:sucrase ferredoxin [Streptomyces reniochalinae]RCG22213.1 sucrase ferredoxin [Streptomyces reniochalinae]